jgi:hypothetical protein
MRFEILMAVKMSVLVVTPCGLVGRTEDGGSMFLQNAGIYLQVHMALQPRRSPPTRIKQLHKTITITSHFTW